MTTHSHAPPMKGGVAELKSALPEIMAKLPPVTMEVAKKTADNIAKRAQERADQQYHGTHGNFNIEARHLSNGAGVYADWFWFFGEFGTSHQPARPYMIPALEESYSEIYPEAAAIFKEGLNVSEYLA